MPLLTLVPETIAAVGYRFHYLGDPKAMECEGCPVRDLCYRLEPGRTYRVTDVRDVTHSCELHDEGRVSVCTVEEVPVRLSVPAKDLRGTATHWTAPACGMPECPSYAFCHPAAPSQGAKVELINIEDAMDCPAGLSLHRALVKPMN